VLKLLATSLTLGSGASGGVFSPALFMGATLGGAYGLFLKWLLPQFTIEPIAFAVAGMAGLVGGATGAALAAIVMIFEMTTDYSVIIPMTITVVLSYGVRRILMEESIYTMKLVRRGHYVPGMLRANLEYLKKAKEIMDTRVVAVSAATTLKEFSLQLRHDDSPRWFLVQDDERLIGVVPETIALRAVTEADLATTLADVVMRNYVTVPGDATLFSVLGRMRKQQAAVALVTSGSEKTSAAVHGIITTECIADSMAEAAELFED
jgi:CIC family chloride channel protein